MDNFRKEVGKVWNLAGALLLLLGVYAGSEREFEEKIIALSFCVVVVLALIFVELVDRFGRIHRQLEKLQKDKYLD
tara:strand:+ start:68 stop:295 length:228 start_codon:yes stop_codon:yes gene_type:complete